jgi:hypothetical protein
VAVDAVMIRPVSMTSARMITRRRRGTEIMLHLQDCRCSPGARISADYGDRSSNQQRV